MKRGPALLLGLFAMFATTGAAKAFSLTQLLNTLVAERAGETSTGVAYGPGPRQRLDIYRPVTGQERRPIVVFYYGGGWTSGERATYAFVGGALAARGYTTVIPDYRVFPDVKFPTFVDDAATAYQWTNDTLAGGCGDPRPVIVIGHSAGAYIAAMIALDRTRGSRDGAPVPQPAALIGLAGPYAFDPTTWPSTKTIFAPAAAKPDAARPITFARTGAPPSLILHGRADTTVQPYNSRDFTTALTTRGNAAQLKEYDGIGHAGLVMAIAPPLRWRAPVLDDMLAFLDRHGGRTMLSRTCAKARADLAR